MDQDPPQMGINVQLNVRPARDEDEPFLDELRAELDNERLLFDHAMLEEEEKKLLLEIQNEAYKRHYENADWEKMHCIIEFDGKPVGTFINFYDDEEIRLADIVIAKSHRGLGVGFAVIQGVQGEAENSKRPLRLHVEKTNPALQLYEQMGFRLLEDRGSHLFLEWTPPSLQGKTLYFPGQG